MIMAYWAILREYLLGRLEEAGKEGSAERSLK